MKRFKNILVVSNQKTEDKTLLKRAVDLAMRNSARVMVLEVIEGLPPNIQSFISVEAPQELQDLVIKIRQMHLNDLVKPIQEEGVQIDFKVLTGTPFLQIIQEVLKEKHDLVMMTAEGKSALNEQLFGSTSLHLMRKCPCPVWIMKPKQQRRYLRILAAVDPDSDDQTRNALNIKIMDLAASLAYIEQSELHIVHAWTLWAEPVLRNQGKLMIPDEKLDQWAYDNHKEHEKQMNKLLEGYFLDYLKEHQVHLVEGEPGTVIHTLAAEQQIDLIIMGTVCRTGLAGFFIGNTAEKVLQQVDCSVLTVKPDGFVSPVKLTGIDYTVYKSIV